MTSSAPAPPRESVPPVSGASEIATAPAATKAPVAASPGTSMPCVSANPAAAKKSAAAQQAEQLVDPELGHEPERRREVQCFRPSRSRRAGRLARTAERRHRAREQAHGDRRHPCEDHRWPARRGTIDAIRASTSGRDPGGNSLQDPVVDEWDQDGQALGEH